MQRCPFCGSRDLVTNAARGDTVCGNPACGELLEEKTLVAEMTFTTGSAGQKFASGARVVWNTPGITNSQEIAVARGVTKLSYIADRLQLGAQISEAGRRMYQLAVQMNFSSGRSSRFVASACLYVICRRNRSPHLLIDFSDVLQAPVRDLGQVYMKLLRRLVGGQSGHALLGDTGAIEVPIVDPSIFIERFSRQLDFGPHQRKVQNTAMRLIQFMHRDWVCVGRRPNGLCGAALLIAAFYHNQRCTAKDISSIVRMGEDTLRQRLQELQQTPLALMSREDFAKIDDKNLPLPPITGVEPSAIVPPCMRERQRREAVAALQGQAALADYDASGASPALQDSACDSASTPAAVMPPPAGLPRGRRKRASADQEQAEVSLVAHPSAGGSNGSRSRGSGGSRDGGGALGAEAWARAEIYTSRRPSGGDIEDIARDIAQHHDIEGILQYPTAGGAAATASAGGQSSASRDAAAARIGELVASPAEHGELPLVLHEDGPRSGGKPGGPEPLSLPEAAVAPASGRESGGEEPLSDVDDDELDRYLLDEEERQHKSDMWHEVNKDYLEEWHMRGREASKRRREKPPGGSCAGSEPGADSMSETGSGTSRGRRWRPKADSCTQSAMMALAKKGRIGSNRINIEALESLFS